MLLIFWISSVMWRKMLRNLLNKHSLSMTEDLLSSQPSSKSRGCKALNKKESAKRKPSLLEWWRCNFLSIIDLQPKWTNSQLCYLKMRESLQIAHARPQTPKKKREFWKGFWSPQSPSRRRGQRSQRNDQIFNAQYYLIHINLRSSTTNSDFSKFFLFHFLFCAFDFIWVLDIPNTSVNNLHFGP